MSHNIIPLLLLFGLMSCASQGFMRSEYNIEKFDDLITSNSSAFDRKLELELSKDHVTIHYDFLAENLSKSKTYILDLKASSFETNTFMQSTTCTSRTSNANLNLVPGSREKITCKIDVTADAKNKLALKDTLGLLRVPVTAPRKGELVFTYKLRVEDFQ